MIKYITDYADDNAQEMLSLVSRSPEAVLFLDTETTGLNFWTDDILLLQVMVSGNIYIFDIRKLGYRFLNYVVEVIESSSKKVVGHNIKFDIKFIYNKTGILLTNLFDTMITEAIITAGIGKSFYSLEELVDKYLGISIDKKIREDFFNNRAPESFSESQLNYAATDVSVLRTIYDKQLEGISNLNLDKILQLEMSLIHVIAKMEINGIILDAVEWLKLNDSAKSDALRLRDEFKDKLFSSIDFTRFSNAMDAVNSLSIPVKRKSDITLLDGISDSTAVKDAVTNLFNLSSPKQVLSALRLVGIQIDSTDAKVLKDFKGHEIISILLSLREQEKLVSTYGGNFLGLINPATGRIHTEYMNVGAATGRLSSLNPNLQNIPATAGRRKCFISAKDHLLATYDYNQQEYRALGAISGEDAIISAYREGKDMHAATAALVFNKDIADVEKDERQFAKGVNFALIYGSTAWGLKHNLDIPMERAEQIVASYHRGYPKLKVFRDEVEKLILENGYSITLMGRKRFNKVRPTMITPNEYMQYKGQVLREGFNVLIQGTCADIVKLAMLNIHNDNPFGDKLKMLLQVHDELVCEVHQSIADDAGEFIKTTMLNTEQPFLGDVPAAVDGKILPYWSK